MGETGDKSIFLIVLNFNGFEDTMECICSLQKMISAKNIECKIVVVDNHSTDDSYNLLQNNLPDHIILLESSCNAGYAYGNNIGIKYSLDQGADYICILNNDTIIVEDFLTPCITELERRKDLAFVSPMLIGQDGMVQNTGGSISILKGKSYEINKNVPEKAIREDIIECEIVYGAAKIFRSSLVDEIGLIPEGYFLFYEETEWCYKANRSGLVNCIIAKTKLVHKKSKSLRLMSDMQTYLMERNRTLFVKRNSTKGQLLLFLIYGFFAHDIPVSFLWSPIFKVYRISL